MPEAGMVVEIFEARHFKVAKWSAMQNAAAPDVVRSHEDPATPGGASRV